MKKISDYNFPINIDDFPMERTPTINHPQVYVLELHNEKYYVGHAVDVYRRIRNHKSDGCSIWTKEHGIKAILQVTDGNHEDENSITIEMMYKYGWENVRGGKWCKLLINEPNELKVYREKVESKSTN